MLNAFSEWNFKILAGTELWCVVQYQISLAGYEFQYITNINLILDRIITLNVLIKMYTAYSSLFLIIYL